MGVLGLKYINIGKSLCIALTVSVFTLIGVCANADEIITYDALNANGEVAIDSSNFPDPVFRSYVADNFDSDSNGYLNQVEASNVSGISLNNMGISSLEGIEFFPSLTELQCAGNQITSLDLSSNTCLVSLVCSNNFSLTNLDISGCAKIAQVWCDNNNLTSLDLNGNREIYDLSCWSNPIVSLDISNNVHLIEALRFGYINDYGSYINYTFQYTNVPSPPAYDAWLVVPSDTEVTASGGTVSMGRLYNPNSGEHFYTSNASELKMLMQAGWQYEGIGWSAPSTSNTPVYRLYNANGGEHHYTTNEAERDMLVSVGWSDEGIGWYSDDNQTVPLYRQYNPNAFANNHNYTTSLGENDWLVSLGWQAEGIGWYGLG